MSNPKKILIVAPSFPYPESGAEQADRADGFRQLVRLGYQVVVIAKVVAWADIAQITEVARSWGVRLVVVPYQYSNRTLTLKEKIIKTLGKLRSPLYLDGAAYEYAEPVIQQALKQELASFMPDVVWFEYTYLWPLYAQVRSAGVSIVTRSVNFEPEHFLEEKGRSPLNYIKYAAKWLGERRSVTSSTHVFAITPKEKGTYRRWGTKTSVLPLRALPKYVAMPRQVIRDTAPLHVCFMGSSFSVEHNRAAAAHIIEQVAPEVQQKAPGAFVFHVFGGKLPDELKAKCDGVTLIYEGYVQDLDLALAAMDIALVPSLYGAGMQQKVFEPLARGIPTITSPRAIAGYPFVDNVSYLGARTKAEYVEALLALREPERREELSGEAVRVSKAEFAQASLDATVLAVLKDIA